MAVHTSEDIDVRSIATIVADTVNIEPRLASYLDRYNPFAADEVNERHHKQACKAVIRTILVRIQRGQSFDFKDCFRKQNIELIKHNALGWCAPGVQAVTQIITDIQNRPLNSRNVQKPEDILAQISNAFESVTETISWQEIKKLFTLIHENKRLGYSFSGASILALLETSNFDHVHFYKSVFAPYGDSFIYDAVQERQEQIQDSLVALKRINDDEALKKYPGLSLADSDARATD